ncbi:hypothetical protein J2Y40_003840 [Chryseobacterium sp. 2987]|nr:hypothetical protein [Chryseobacterium sp. 2987]
MNNLIANYERILEVLREISDETLLSYQRRIPKMKDLEVVSLVLTAEYMGIVDSMPLEICKISRSARSKICKDKQYCYPNRGFCASQQMSFYGYKLHSVCSLNRVFQSNKKELCKNI